MNQYLFAAPLVCYLLVIPMGVAGQNIGLGVALALLLVWMNQRGFRLSLQKLRHSKPLIQFLLCWAVYVIPIVASTVIAGKEKDAARFFWGHLFGIVIPIYGAMLAEAQIKDFPVFVRRVFFLLVTVLGLASLSQIAFPWQLQNGEIQSAIARARGFYSHPLTFAYVLLFFVPWSVVNLLSDRLTPQKIWLFFCILVAVLASQSVTVIALSALIVFAAVVLLMKGRRRLGALIIGSGLFVGIIATENSVSDKLRTVLTGNRSDDETAFHDDRIAFWLAHTKMIETKPLIGFGTGLEASDRKPFYEMIGLPDIKRMYEAHNMYLQAAVEGGIVAGLGILLCLLWLARLILTSKRLFLPQRFQLIATTIFIGLAGLTQNALQDSEVRFVFLGFVGVTLYLCIRPHNLPLSSKTQKPL